MEHTQTWLQRRPLLIGVVHLLPTPGAPRFEGGVDRLFERARVDARALVDGGCDALIVENFGDAPFHPERVPSETIACMSLALFLVRSEAGELPVGVNVLRNDARAALGIASATGASFVRVNVHVGAAVTDQGILEGRADQTLRERARICPKVAILADVHVKHATPLGSESIAQAALDARERGLADGLIVSGARTGAPVARADLLAVREALGEAPLLLGSGLTEECAAELLDVADGAIVGTSLKRGGSVQMPVDLERVRSMRARMDALAG